MKLKLLISRAGVGFSQNVGDVIEVETEEAERLVEAGQAVSVETASKKPAENASKKVKRKK